MTDESPDFESAPDALDTLDDVHGQGVILAEDAYEFLRHFAQFWEDGYALQVEIAEMAEMAYLENASTRCEPWDAIMPINSISELLVEMYDAEPSRTSYIGTGFTLDARHEENMDVLREEVDGWPSDEDEVADDE